MEGEKRARWVGVYLRLGPSVVRRNTTRLPQRRLGERKVQPPETLDPVGSTGTSTLSEGTVPTTSYGHCPGDRSRPHPTDHSSN